MTFMQFNVSVLGRIDLDDTDHIFSSDHLISVAREAGTFVGDAAKNIIDFRASYDDYRMEIENEDWTADWRAHVRERLVTALDFLASASRPASISILSQSRSWPLPTRICRRVGRCSSSTRTARRSEAF